ncbi:MAG: hypothetical protein LUE64_06085 [Candidatus Gastranaerophilales bacterium]|nr:hypothetical protein [Candidatus Gastranaerophilales bacterium]
MAEHKKLTTEMILKKKGLIEQAPVPFYSDLFNAEIEVENTHPQGIVDVMASGSVDEIYMYSRLIYENCPIFRDKTLIKEYEVDDPYMLAKKIYGANVLELLQLGNYILSVYGANTQSIEDVKKK